MGEGKRSFELKLVSFDFLSLWTRLVMEPARKKKLPSLDDSFDSSRESDSPSLHQGRTRKQAHVVGQWAAHVYLELIPSAVLRKILDEVVEMVKSSTTESIQSLLSVDSSSNSTATPSESSTPSAEAPLVTISPESTTKGKENAPQIRRLPLHLSLSRPLLLQTAQRESLRTAVRKVANQSKGFEGSYAEFSMLENDEATRRFLSVEIGFGFAQMKEIVDTLDPHLQQLRLPSYYVSPRFHSSIAWTALPTIDPERTIPFDEAALLRLEERFGDRLRKEKIFVGELVCKIGKEEERFPFP